MLTYAKKTTPSRVWLVSAAPSALNGDLILGLMPGDD